LAELILGFVEARMLRDFNAGSHCEPSSSEPSLCEAEVILTSGNGMARGAPTRYTMRKDVKILLDGTKKDYDLDI
jgi:hypothetical protein